MTERTRSVGEVADNAAGVDGELARLSVSGVEVATYVDGRGLDPTLAPRPYLHPVRSLGGTPVSAASPEDHRWHLGVGVAVQDVDGCNFWGGRTYVRGEGYQWRADHGRIRHEGWSSRAPGSFVERLGWFAPHPEHGPGTDGERLLEETRVARAGERLGYTECWTLELSFSLRNVTDRVLPLGSPATNGRTGAGYGGFFWRLPVPASRVWLSTPDAEGEEAVHGRPADWLAVRFRPALDVPDAPGDPVSPVSPVSPAAPRGSAVTLVFEAVDRDTERDPWFVRAAGYLGVGSSLAAEVPVRVRPRESLDRWVRTHVVDGALDDLEVDALVGAQRRSDW